MPPSQNPSQQQARSDARVMEDPYPPQAYEFIHEGLDYTVRQHASESGSVCHVSGQQLCEGLRELALTRWGRLAGTVLRRWNIRTTMDFGRIVYNLIEMGRLQKLDEDSIDDFKAVYDFSTAFESTYRFPSHQ